ncbi:MAG: TatD family hydrolase [Acidobacteriota bacterium]|nr:TatD family hydrolase [Acidobacteriota bacterium]
MLVDSHCHIADSAFDADRATVIERAENANVRFMLSVGTGEPASGNFEQTIGIAEQHENIFASIGIHPHDAKTYDERAEQQLINLAKSSRKVVAWGEIGLDFYYDHSPREIQEQVFRRQIRIAQDLGLPIIIHSRDANDETVQILTEECARPNFAGGVMHCFGGTAAMAEELMKIGFYISFAGNVTFKKADDLREAARIVPLEKLLIETDCPYLAPVPLRGKRNEPAFVLETARFLADFKGVELEELAKRTTENFFRIFRLNQSLI